MILCECFYWKLWPGLYFSFHSFCRKWVKLSKMIMNVHSEFPGQWASWDSWELHSPSTHYVSSEGSAPSLSITGTGCCHSLRGQGVMSRGCQALQVLCSWYFQTTLVNSCHQNFRWPDTKLTLFSQNDFLIFDPCNKEQEISSAYKKHCESMNTQDLTILCLRRPGKPNFFLW